MCSENDIINVRWNDMRVKGLYFHYHNVEKYRKALLELGKHISKIGVF